MVLVKFDPILGALREKDGGATDLSGLAGSYAVSGNYLLKVPKELKEYIILGQI